MSKEQTKEQSQRNYISENVQVSKFMVQNSYIKKFWLREKSEKWNIL